MTRYMAILTLALTTALSAGEALAGKIGYEPAGQITYELDELIAITALIQTAEAGMDDISGMLHAYDALLDLGFRAEDAAIVLVTPDSGSPKGSSGGSGGTGVTNETADAVFKAEQLTQPHSSR